MGHGFVVMALRFRRPGDRSALNDTTPRPAPPAGAEHYNPIAAGLGPHQENEALEARVEDLLAKGLRY